MTASSSSSAACFHDRDRHGARQSRPRGRRHGVLVILFGVIAVVDILLSQFIDTEMRQHCRGRCAASWLDALYGLMAPERQKQRDKLLRRR